MKGYLYITLKQRIRRIFPNIREPFEKFVDWWQCAAVMQREAVTYAKL
jgi:hypothetical protein